MILSFDTLILRFFVMMNDYLLYLSVKYYRPIFIAVKCFVLMSTFGNTKYILKSILTSLLLIPHSYRLYILSAYIRSMGLRWTVAMVLERGASR